MAAPISLGLLPHSVLLKHIVSFDRERNPTYQETTIHNVRIAATWGISNDQAGMVRTDTLNLFIDCIYSKYETTEGVETEAVIPVINDCITWQNKDYTVKSVSPCYADSKAIHHYEVTLA